MVSVDLVKDLMSQDYPDCPYDFVLGKEFLPNFALEANKRLPHMRAFQKHCPTQFTGSAVVLPSSQHIQHRYRIFEINHIF
jgi:chromosome segregation and condensation protein ScpB